MPSVWLVSDNLLERVREVFDYKDGNLYWKKCNAAWIKPGSIVGSVRKDGYRTTQLDGKKYLVHRLIFLYHHGWCPEYIDHIDRNPRNNDISNLRPTTKRLNSYNRKAPSNSSSGVPGVSWDSQQSKWTVRFKHNGKYEFHGYFVNKEDAINKRKLIENRRVSHAECLLSI